MAQVTTGVSHCSVVEQAKAVGPRRDGSGPWTRIMSTQGSDRAHFKKIPLEKMPTIVKADFLETMALNYDQPGVRDEALRAVYERTPAD